MGHGTENAAFAAAFSSLIFDDIGATDVVFIDIGFGTISDIEGKGGFEDDCTDRNDLAVRSGFGGAGCEGAIFPGLSFVTAVAAAE